MLELKSAIAIIIAISPILIISTNIVFAAEDVKADFRINDFGITDGNPWLTVEGTAGDTTPQNESLIYAYVFVTDAGTFAATSHGGEDSAEVANDTQWHTHEVTLDEKNCVSSINDNGKNELANDKITIIGTNATKVDTVQTGELTKDADGKICVTKVFDSAP